MEKSKVKEEKGGSAKKKYQRPSARLTKINVGVWGGSGSAGSCLASTTKILTLKGDIPVKQIKVGQLVWTLNKNGKRVTAPVIKISKTRVPQTHHVIHLILKDGRELWVSPDHPIISKKKIHQLRKRQAYDRSTVLYINLVSYVGKYTYDILPDGDMGHYWANNILIGSTLGYDFTEENYLLIKRILSFVEFLPGSSNFRVPQ